jgi:transglutaminase-like putative cysteine protease
VNTRLTVSAAAATAAASVALHPLISGASWFWGGVGAITVVGCAAALSRLRRLPVVICFAASACGLLLYLNAAFSGRRSLTGVIPTRASLIDLLHLAGQGYAEASRLAPPVPPVGGILLLAVTGIGGVAVLTDLIAVRLRHTAAAGLPLLALFSVTVATRANESRPAQALVFAAGIAGYLVLLAADGRERISAWGRLVAFPAASRAGRQRAQPGTQPESQPGAQPGAQPGTQPGEARLPDTRSLAVAGRRVGLAAVAVALIVPLFVPGLRVQGLPPGNAAAGTGPGNGLLPTSLPDPVARMYGQLRESRPQPVLSYSTDDPEPPYLRQYVLNLFSDGWNLAFPAKTIPAAGKLPAPPGLQDAPAQTVHTTLKFAGNVASRGQNFLPVPYPPVSLNIGRGWQADTGTLMIASTASSVAGLGYGVTSDDVEPTATQLRRAPAPPDSITLEYLNLPTGYTPYLTSLRSLAQRAAKGARTPFDQAVAMQQWLALTGGFSYSLTSSVPDSPAGLVRFLTVTKSGYCQQFAIAMAILARVLGIPSRVAVGYTAGSNVGGPNFQVTSSDAHAWPELYFQGAGWLRFEPTPAGDSPGQGTATPPVYTLPSNNGGSAGTYQPGTLGETSPRAPTGVTGGAAAQHHPKGSSPSSGTVSHPVPRDTPPWGPIAGLVILAALLAPAVSRPLVSRWRWLAASGDTGRARAAWLELRDTLADLGIPAADSESPRSLARRVEGQLPAEARGALLRIAIAEERARYATSPADSRSLRADTAAVRRAIAATAGWRARLRARCLPASVLTPAGRAGRQALDVFGWIEVGATWLVGRLIRRITTSHGTS